MKREVKKVFDHFKQRNVDKGKILEKNLFLGKKWKDFKREELNKETVSFELLLFKNVQEGFNFLKNPNYIFYVKKIIIENIHLTEIREAMTLLRMFEVSALKINNIFELKNELEEYFFEIVEEYGFTFNSKNGEILKKN